MKYRKHVTMYNSFPWTTNSFELNHCRKVMRNDRLVLDDENVGRIKQSRNALVQKLKELKATLEKAKESPKVKKALKAIGVLLVLLSGTAIGVLISKAVGKNIDAKTAANKAQEVVNDIKKNSAPIVTLSQSDEVDPKYANLMRVFGETLKRFERSVTAFIKDLEDDNISYEQAILNYGKNVGKENSIRQALPRKVQTPKALPREVQTNNLPKSEAKIPSQRKQLLNTLNNMTKEIQVAKNLIRSVRPGLTRGNDDVKKFLSSSLINLSTAERKIPTNVIIDDFTEKDKQFASGAIQRSLELAEDALDSFTGYETNDDESQVKMIIKRIKEVGQKLNQVKVLDSKRFRLDNSYIDHYIDVAIRREMERYGIL